MEDNTIIKISDIYDGVIDAEQEDEIRFSKKYYHEPVNVKLEDIIEKENTEEKYFIIGNKGVGKSALIKHIKCLLKEKNSDAILSQILFKKHYQSSVRNRSEKFLTTICIDDEIVSWKSYKNLWLLYMYVIIIMDNEQSNYLMFDDDDDWKNFKQKVYNVAIPLKIVESQNIIRMLEIPTNKILYDPSFDLSTNIATSTALDEEDFEDEFETIIYRISALFVQLKKKSDVPYYLAIDELETNLDNPKYMRDLNMIVGWIQAAFTLKKYISVSRIQNMKVILSIRSEMLKAIEKEIIGIELNKIYNPYRIDISWKIKTNDFEADPLFGIWLNRISCALNEKHICMNKKEIYDNYFDSTVGSEDMYSFIMNRTWYKPRDIVRFMTLLKSKGAEQSKYTRGMFYEMLEQYSKDSWLEIQEEMSAMHSNELIKYINTIFTDYEKSYFYKSHLTERLGKLGLLKLINITELLSILYDYGIIGTQIISTKNTRNIRWKHKGNDFEDNPNQMYIIHPALTYNFNIVKIYEDQIYKYDILDVSLTCRIQRVTEKNVCVTFAWEGNIHQGKIAKKYLKNNIGDIHKYYIKNRPISAYISSRAGKTFDKYSQMWIMTECR